MGRNGNGPAAKPERLLSLLQSCSVLIHDVQFIETRLEDLLGDYAHSTSHLQAAPAKPLSGAKGLLYDLFHLSLGSRAVMKHDVLLGLVGPGVAFERRLVLARTGCSFRFFFLLS